MKVESSWTARDMTILKLTESIPLTDWRKMTVGGVEFKPFPVMDSGENVIAVKGKHDLTGKRVVFA